MNTAELHLVDDDSKRDSRGRRQMPKAERERLAKESLNCGISLRDFARSEGINYNSLIYWRQQLRDKAPAPQTLSEPTVHFAECTLPANGHPLEVQLPDGTLVRGNNAEAIAHLIKALRC